MLNKFINGNPITFYKKRSHPQSDLLFINNKNIILINKRFKSDRGNTPTNFIPPFSIIKEFIDSYIPQIISFQTKTTLKTNDEIKILHTALKLLKIYSVSGRKFTENRMLNWLKLEGGDLVISNTINNISRNKSYSVGEISSTSWYNLQIHVPNSSHIQIKNSDMAPIIRSELSNFNMIEEMGMVLFYIIFNFIINIDKGVLINLNKKQVKSPGIILCNMIDKYPFPQEYWDHQYLNNLLEGYPDIILSQDILDLILSKFTKNNKVETLIDLYDILINIEFFNINLILINNKTYSNNNNNKQLYKNRYKDLYNKYKIDFLLPYNFEVIMSSLLRINHINLIYNILQKTPMDYNRFWFEDMMVRKLRYLSEERK
ncbi:hypothetical protein (mitochondrion) [Myxobolus squamalis]|uniref:Uncharacterized protein n=1 Tax=Myxobolus squamalis TaxID=59785 RepID=A0A678XC19_MYXSQ|nr:hypothetical protein [Myxobolus squamalis]